MIYDAIVVGSGPGGAVAAATLADKGKSVLLVDRQAFPRDKVCGDGLPANVMKMMNTQLGIDTQKIAWKYQRIHGVSIAAPSGRSLLVPEAPNQWFSTASPRYEFDNLLHQYALKRGAKFEVMDIEGPLFSGEGDNQQVVGIVQRKNKARLEHEARVVIAADGASSAIARGVRGRVSDTRDTAVAIRAYGRLKKPIPPYVFFKYQRHFVPGYGWIFPVAEDQANIGLGLFDQGIYKRQGKNLKVLLDQFAAELQAEFPFEIEPSSIKSWPIPIWISPESRVLKGVYLVGDAGRFVDALTGGGIYPAMVTGLLAARSAVDILDGGDRGEAALAYDTAWRNGIAKDLRKALLVQKYVGSRIQVFSSIFAIATLNPSLKKWLLHALAGQHN